MLGHVGQRRARLTLQERERAKLRHGQVCAAVLPRLNVHSSEEPPKLIVLMPPLAMEERDLRMIVDATEKEIEQFE